MPRGGRAGRPTRSVIAGPFPFPGHGAVERRGQDGGPGLVADEVYVEPPLPPQPDGNLAAGECEIGLVLDGIGFSPVLVQHFVNVEGISTLNHFLLLHRDVIDKIFTRLDTAGIHYTAIQLSLMKSLHNYIKRMSQLNMAINPVAIDYNMLAEETNHIEESKVSSVMTQKSRVSFPEKF